jgi:hypothetical protein
VTIEIADGDRKRRVVYEHIWGARAAGHQCGAARRRDRQAGDTMT